MDKACIFNVYDFVSFHICQTLLNKGIEVEGIQLENDSKEPFLEEKRLEVGRNANFEEKAFSLWADRGNGDQHNTIIIFSLYDLYMQHKETILQKKVVTDPILGYFDHNRDKSNHIIFLLPIQLLTRPFYSQTLSDFQGFLDQAMDLTENFQLFYLPTVYGPWQPTTFLFQQSILTKINENEEFRESREMKLDAIYIEDALETIVEVIETREPGSYLLESGKLNHWKRCAAFLNIEVGQVDNRDSFHLNHQISKMAVKKVTSISESMNKQMDQIHRLYLMR
jgi:hypothetical protein